MVSARMVANISAVSRFELVTSSRYPSPLSAPTNSPTTAPAIASVAATFRPLNRYGRLVGRRNARNTCIRVAPIERARSFISEDIERRPTAASMTIGKNEIRKATSIFGVTPTPNHTRKSGAIAIFGTTWKKSIVGMTNRSKRELEVIAIASGTAIPTASA